MEDTWKTNLYGHRSTLPAVMAFDKEKDAGLREDATDPSLAWLVSECVRILLCGSANELPRDNGDPPIEPCLICGGFWELFPSNDCDLPVEPNDDSMFLAAATKKKKKLLKQQMTQLSGGIQEQSVHLISPCFTVQLANALKLPITSRTYNQSKRYES